MPARTPSQTVGPFFHEALRWPDGGHVRMAAPGNRVVVSGRILDGAGNPVADALLETWQRGADGRPPAAAASGRPSGFGRVQTGQDGTFRIETSMPGGGVPCLDVTILARGVLKALRTRVYLAPETAARGDPLLAPLAASPRVLTLVAQRAADGEFHWDIRLQGEGETIFFAS